jgi:peptidoglycan/xylan/chitin deacetylase (PgdA/CDA1 family)
MRTDRLFSIGLVHPALRLLNGHREGRVPILMYHGIRSVLENRHPYYETTTSPQMFACQMQFLRDNGYKTITIGEALEYLTCKEDDVKRVVLTFDDAYQDFYTAAFPTLSNHGFTATVFVVSSFATIKPLRFADRTFMKWEQIREVHSHGIEIGSHTVSHPELWKLHRRDLGYELMHSKETIEDAIGSSIRSFSHPFAFPEHDTEYIQTLSRLLD